MATDKRQFTLRLNDEVFEKIKLIASKNKRSLTMHIEYVIEQHIAEYEKENGTIQEGPQ
ncbi:Arc family DNA-binding protein [Cohnella nanjingensis]|uniref:Arc family DNA-binding protein n=1 Tax=Cohnella nanjingensis TaxID=1387779 RepID=A0A7X0RV28_9BACL|nr:Arc family DNA-binding protein [Cohnella nanjingensis]MBB6672634.1 Arc family DNA-binding protein [Cohnella nanjingensis]